MMRWLIEPGAPPNLGDHVVFDRPAGSFLTGFTQARPVTTLLVNDIQIGLDGSDRAVGIDGYCPEVSWRRMNLGSRSPEIAVARVDTSLVSRGPTLRLTEPGEWPVAWDNVCRWLRLGPGTRHGSRIVAVNANSAVEIATTSSRLVAVWIRAEF